MLRNVTLKLVQTNPLSSGIEFSELRKYKVWARTHAKQSSEKGILEFRKTKNADHTQLGVSSVVVSFYLKFSSGTLRKVHQIKDIFCFMSNRWLGSAPLRCPRASVEDFFLRTDKRDYINTCWGAQRLHNWREMLVRCCVCGCKQRLCTWTTK